ncbi:MAG: phage holin family protein [Ardenticatenales bacterium]|nr:phage holin family protein [Ardenticatenales bacterium]
MLDHKAPTADASVSTILADLVDSSQTFVRKEVELHKAEALDKVQTIAKEKGRGVGLLLGGGIFALLGLAFLGITLFFILQSWLSPWLSALIVTLLYFLVGGILAYMGKMALAGPKVEQVANDAERVATSIEPQGV